MNSILKNTMIITAITLVAGLLLGIVYNVTYEPIEVAKQAAKMEAFSQVIDEADSFDSEGTDFDYDKINADLADNGFEKDKIDEIAVAMDENGNTIGYVLTVTSKEGFGGDITFTVGIMADGTTKGISFLSISETAGLGMEAKEDAFKSQFSDKNVESFVYTKSGATADNEIDALSGATITTNAVTNGVDAALYVFNNELGGASNE